MNMTLEQLERGKQIQDQIKHAYDQIVRFEELRLGERRVCLRFEIGDGTDFETVPVPFFINARDLMKRIVDEYEKDIDSLTKEFESL